MKSVALVAQALPAVPGTAGDWLSAGVAVAWPSLLEATVAAVGTLIAVRIARAWVAAVMRRARVDVSTLILVRRALSISLVAFGSLLVLGFLGISPATVLALVGAAGLALGLAVQDILRNFFSGVYILLERPFRVGDVIRVKDQEGKVENIGVRTTALRTDENVLVLVPNALMFSEVVSDRTRARPPQNEVDGHTEVPGSPSTPPLPPTHEQRGA